MGFGGKLWWKAGRLYNRPDRTVASENPKRHQPEALDLPPAPFLGPLIAAGFLTRLPLPLPAAAWERPPGPAAALGWAPLVGALLGVALGLALIASLALGLPPLAAAFLALALSALATGALHEDGLADVADGLGARGGPAERLAAMRDSRIGAYGVLALVLATGLKAALLAEVAGEGSWAVLAVLALLQGASRAHFAPALAWAQPAGKEGLAASIGRAPSSAAWLSLGLALALLLPVAPAVAWLPAALGLLALQAGFLGLARRRLGGYTGDVLGAGQQLAEIWLLAVLAWAAS